ncbi:hypothetical protein [Paenibacillus macquariensis]|uniref:Uncharacterized protein n=1 Tax=Paenibacillus macquariensis TaxID=948756 RepID=A0ABY1KG66_9BACL|nr:hypothetical protein [Paenibacillus macquariensis]MEC0093799.1 hypothetical protein [Paenibacillus macquariensis]OAB26367.1 hypothetical protein PMSM_26815 [Paenibacillus macquariensis subsp. macquariensis]SIR65738.1 hypothetical protein SAMN05421578_12818 [Paenibacillus macquariensis]
MNGALNSTNLLEDDCHLVLLVNVFNYLKREVDDQEQLNKLKLQIQSLYKIKFNINFMKEIYDSDAKLLLLIWNDFENIDIIKSYTFDWFGDRSALEDFLELIFAHKANLKNYEQLVSNFVGSINYMPDSLVKTIFSQNKPSSEMELMDYKLSEKTPFTGEFIYAKNIFYNYVIDELRNIQEISVSNHQSMGRPLPFIENGIKLIKKFGNSKQKDSIEKIEKEMDEYINVYNEEREAEEEFRREMNEIIDF